MAGVCAGGSLVRTYTVSYSYSPISKNSRITRVQECSRDGVCRNPVKFDWANNGHPSTFKDYTNIVYPSISPAPPTFTRSYTTGDMNGDGRTDIAMLFEVSGKLRIDTHISRGNGGYSRHPYLSTTSFKKWAPVRSLLSGDVDGDGKTDLIIFTEKASGSENKIKISIHTFISLGNGQYRKEDQDTTSPAPPTFTRSYTAGDINGDGRTDIAMLFEHKKKLNIDTYISKGNGKYREKEVYSTETFFEKWAPVRSFLSGDVDGDGRTDLMLFTEGTDRLKIHTFISLGNGQYRKEDQDTASPAPPTFTRSYTAGDINGDGRTDIAMLFEHKKKLNIDTYISKGNGEYREKEVYSTETSFEKWAPVRSFLSGDVNGDGKTDLMLVYEHSNQLNIDTFVSDGNGGYHKGIYKTGSPSVPLFLGASAGDLNGDGASDILMFFQNNSKLNIDTFFSELNVPDKVVSVTNENGTKIAVKYANRGGAIDAASRNGGTQTYSARNKTVNRSRAATFSSDTSNFSQRIAADNTTNAHADIARFKYGDFNGDGKTDILHHDGGFSASTNLSVHLSKGDGTFDTKTRTGPAVWLGTQGKMAQHDLNRIWVADFDGDGKSDILHHDGRWGTTTKLSVYLSKGDGTFIPKHRQGPSLALGGDARFSVYLLAVVGTPIPRIRRFPDLGGNVYPAEFDLKRIKLGDFNADGKTDIYIVEGWGNSNSDRVCLSSGNGSFNCTNTGNGSYVSADARSSDLERVLVGDFNGDGASDIFRVEAWGDSRKARVCLSRRNAHFHCYNDGPQHSISSNHDRGKLDISRFRLGDFNGDGKTDIYIIQGWGTWANSVEIAKQVKADTVCFSDGDGTFTCTNAGPATAVYSSVTTSDVARVRLGDFDGDGRTDVYRVEGWHNTRTEPDSVWYSHGHRSFTARYASINSKHSKSEAWGFVDIARFGGPVDFNGDRKQDWLCIHSWGDNIVNNVINFSLISAGSINSSNIRPSTLSTAGALPSSTIGNHTKNCSNTNETRTNGYADACGIPNSSPRYLVTWVSVTDTISNQTLTTTYSYQDGRYFTGEVTKRANLGFAQMRTNHPDGKYTINKYLQERKFRGQLKESKTYTSAGQLISKTVNWNFAQYKCNSDGCNLDNSQVLPAGFSRQVRIGTTAQYQYEPGSSSPFLTTKLINTFNTYGHITKARRVVFKGNLRRNTYLLTKYLNNTRGPRAIGLPVQTFSCRKLNSTGDDCQDAEHTLKKTRISYDGKAHLAGLASGDKLAPTRVETWLGNHNNSEVWGGVQRTFNTNGTLIREIDIPTGNQKSYGYSSDHPNVVTHIKQTSGGTGFSSGASSYVETFSDIDPTFIVPKKSLDRNGLKKEITLDSFGRVTGMTYKNGDDPIAKMTNTYVNTRSEISLRQCRHYGENWSESTCSKEYKDGFGRTIKRVQQGVDGTQQKGIVTEVEYDRSGRESKIYKPYYEGGSKGTYTEKRYDVLGRLTRISSYDGRVVEYRYQYTTQTHCITGVQMHGLTTTALHYDSAPARETQSGTYYFADASYRTQTRRNLGGQIYQQYDGYQSTTSSASVCYEHHENGLLKKVKAPQGTTTITYNGLYQQQSITDPNAGETRYTYYNTLGSPSFGQIKTETRPDPNSTTSASTITATNEYKASFGRLSRQYYGDVGSPQINNTFTYDDSSVTFSKGHLTRLVSTASTYTIQKDISYDIYGRSTSEKKTIRHASNSLCTDNEALPCTSLTRSSYDVLGRLASMVHPDGSEVTHEYIGGTSLLKKIKSSSVDYATYSNYNLYSQPKNITYGNGVETTYEYNNTTSLLSRLKVEVSTPGTGGNSVPTKRALLDYSYQFNGLGNITQITDHVLPDLSASYTYDGLNRIKSVNRGGSLSDFTYVFDHNSSGSEALGNLRDKHELTKKRLCYRADCDSSDLTERTTRPHHERVWNEASSSYEEVNRFSWSVAGNLLSKTRTENGTTKVDRYSYDAQNMLRTVNSAGGKTVTNYYDESGQRFLKVYKESSTSPEIRTFYLSPYFERREKHQAGETAPTAFQSTLYIMGADGQRLTSKTSGSYLLADAGSNLNYRLAGMYDPSDIKGLFLKAKHLALGFYYEPSFSKYLYLSLVLLGIFLMLGFVIHQHRHSKYPLAQSLLSGFMTLMILSAFGCGTHNYVDVTEGSPEYGYMLMGSTSGGLPVGTHYYHGNHLGSASLVTDSDGEEVMRINYTPYGEIDQAHSGKLGCSEGASDTSYEKCTRYGFPWTKIYNISEGKNAGVTRKFTGQEYDPENELYYYNARYYDPSIGVFTTADTVVPGEGRLLSLSRSSGGKVYSKHDKKRASMKWGASAYNRYMYVMGNPVRYTDTSGHAPDTVFGHCFTGPHHRCDPDDDNTKGISVIDDISKEHDKMKANCYFKTSCDQRNTLDADLKWMGEASLAIVSTELIWGNISKATETLTKRYGDWGVPLIPLYAAYLILTDLVIYTLGSLLFTLNSLYHAATLNPGGLAIGAVAGCFLGPLGCLAGGIIGGGYIDKPSTKNWDKPSKWKLPEGRGRFKNWNRPGKWRITKNDWKKAGKVVCTILTLGLAKC